MTFSQVWDCVVSHTKVSVLVCLMSFSHLWEWVVIRSKNLFLFCLMTFSQVWEWIVTRAQNLQKIFVFVLFEHILSGLRLVCKSHKVLVSTLSIDVLSDLRLLQATGKFVPILSNDVLSGLKLGWISHQTFVLVCLISFSQVWEWTVLHTKTLFLFCLLLISQIGYK